MEELLTRGPDVRTATIEEYVHAARTLTGLRQYRARLEVVVNEFSNPGFSEDWNYSSRHRVTGELLLVDKRAAELKELLSAVETCLAEPLWESIEQTVRDAAVPLYRQADKRVATLCVPDYEGEWIVKGGDQLVKGTRQELETSQRWTALAEVLPPPHPSEVATMAGPGVR